MKPTLLILAAGMGSRYGSLKQIDQFGPSGETITDYSIYDAIKAGFGKVIFVISPSMEEEFTTSYIHKFPSSLDIDYVIQAIDKIPGGFSIPAGRTKPWGTAHAIFMADGKIDVPFAVINADDFYGRDSYNIIGSYLKQTGTDIGNDFCLAGYPIRNTLSEHGTVSRAVCVIDSSGYLASLTERTKIRESDGRIVYIDEKEKEFELYSSSLVSMNFFGFRPTIFRYIETHFNEFIGENINNPKSELYIPSVVDRLIKEGIAKTKVLKTNATWFGVTYKEDKPHVSKMIRTLVQNGVYPSNLWKEF
jgi:NDP-sugar pyrophosphorylase family protein